jgi:hypothetical protein
MGGLRDSLDLIRMVRPDAGTAAIEHEIQAERANSLGAAEHRVMKAIAALGVGDDRQTLLAEAREAVWAYFVQRELLGFRRHTDVIRDLAIPADVLNGLGVMPVKRR